MSTVMSDSSDLVLNAMKPSTSVLRDYETTDIGIGSHDRQLLNKTRCFWGERFYSRNIERHETGSSTQHLGIVA